MAKKVDQRSGSEIADFPSDNWRIDSAIELPDDIKITIARGAAAFQDTLKAVPNNQSIPSQLPKLISSVTDQEKQDAIDQVFSGRVQTAAGKRQQPPMIDRLRFVMILVDHLNFKGVPFGVGPNSRMNKAVREWLNDKAARSPDPRKSRFKQIGPGAVRELLKQVRALR